MPATFSVQIKGDPSGIKGASRDAKDALESVKQKALDVNAALRSIFGIYALKELISGVYELADSYTTLQNKLRYMTDSQSNLNGVSNATFDIAQRTRSAWETTATTYSRMAQSAKALGTSQKDLLDFTEHLNKQVIVTGATGLEARNGLIQLSQGMASGVLHGQDFRAVLEDIPGVADVIAQHFGVTRGQLRDMAKDGKITAKEIIAAFKEAGPQIDEAFGKTVPTMAQSFTMLHNAAIKFFGEAGTGSGVLTTLAGAIQFVANHFDTFGKIVTSVVEEVGGLLIIVKVTQYLKALWVVAAANPLITLLALLVQGVLLLRQFGDQMQTTERVWTNVDGVFVTVGDHLRALWGVIKELVGVITGMFVEAWNLFTSLFGGGIDTSKTTDGLAGVIDTVAKWVVTLSVLLHHAKDLFIDVFAGIPIILANKFDEAFTGVLDKIVDFVNKIIRMINTLMRFGTSLTRQAVINKNFDVEYERWKENNTTNGVTNPLTPDIKDQLMRAAEIDEATAKGGRPSQQFQFSELQVDHAGLKASADLARAALHDDSAQILADIDKGVAKYKQAIHDSATKRVQDNGTGGDINDVTGQDKTGGAGKYKNNGFDAFLKQLEALTKRSNEVEAAELKLKDANDLLNKSLADNKNVLGGGVGKKYTGAEIVQKLFGISAADLTTDLEKKLRPSLDPFGYWFDETTKKTAAMHGTAEAEQHLQDVVKVTQMLEAKGLIDNRALTIAQRQEIDKLTAAETHRRTIWEEEKKILGDLTGAQQKYFNQLEAFNNLKSQMTPQEQSRVFSDITNAYSHSQDVAYEQWRKKMEKVDPFGSGWTNAVQKMQDDLLNVSKAVENVVTQAFTNLQSFVVDTAMTGKIQWQSLIQGMEKALDELAFKILANYILMKLLTGDTGTSPIGDTHVGGYTSTNGMNMPGIADPFSHAYGGSYTVPGSGSPDTQNVTFRMTKGETAYFVPPGYMGPQPVNGNTSEAKASGSTLGPRGRGGVKTGTTVRIYNSYDRRELLSAIDTVEGKTTIANVIRSMPGLKR